MNEFNLTDFKYHGYNQDELNTMILFYQEHSSIKMVTEIAIQVKEIAAQAAKIEELENELADEAKECHEYYQKNLDLEAKLEKARENFKKIWLKGSGHKIKVFQEMADEALREIGEEGK